MALIKGNTMKKITKGRNAIHNEVDNTYTSFIDNEGNRILQIDTYGSNQREFRGKVSQSIQFDKESAREFMTVIKKEFNI
ncbi:methionyl-tRNA formyltransferase [Bacillus sp. RO2]|uniref:methionyl-tRNA formyltransferase n=1 Tax=Bacillus sp. RO2 TaxID=2723913 RepID=UPI00145D0A91|nr:methionyl-tRNA formyltransferase [Bacillus sp. RO2]NMH73551.1 methionyl-tRNA formyltransferase [Bacillus sp. RO2]